MPIQELILDQAVEDMMEPLRLNETAILECISEEPQPTVYVRFYQSSIKSRTLCHDVHIAADFMTLKRLVSEVIRELLLEENGVVTYCISSH